MHAFRLLVLGFILCFYSCRNKKDTNDSVLLEENLSKIGVNNDYFESDLKPITINNFKLFIPIDIYGFKASDILSSNKNGFSSLSCIYINGDQNIKLIVVDGAGKNNKQAIIFISNQLNKVLDVAKSNNLKTKTENFKGFKTLITENEANGIEVTSINFVYNDRYFIQAIASSMNSLDLKRVLDNLNYDKLN